MRVLIVDDQETFLVLARKIVSRISGFQVVGEAMNGVTAIKLAAELKPDLILMDVTMPVMDGIQAASRILPQHPQTRIVLVSGHDEAHFEKRLQKVGITGFISKIEFNAVTLLSLLNSSTATN